MEPYSANPTLIQQAQDIVDLYALEYLKCLGINEIQTDLEEVDMKIAATRANRFTDVDESQFIALRNCADKLDKYMVTHLNPPRDVSSQLISCYKAIQDQIKHDLAQIERVFAERIDPNTQHNIGRWYLSQRHFTQAMKWFKLAADNGDGGALYTLGVCYFNGWGGGDPVMGRECFDKWRELKK